MWSETTGVSHMIVSQQQIHIFEFVVAFAPVFRSSETNGQHQRCTGKRKWEENR